MSLDWPWIILKVRVRSHSFGSLVSRKRNGLGQMLLNAWKKLFCGESKMSIIRYATLKVKLKVPHVQKFHISKRAFLNTVLLGKEGNKRMGSPNMLWYLTLDDFKTSIMFSLVVHTTVIKQSVVTHKSTILDCYETWKFPITTLRNFLTWFLMGGGLLKGLKFETLWHNYSMYMGYIWSLVVKVILRSFGALKIGSWLENAWP